MNERRRDFLMPFLPACVEMDDILFYELTLSYSVRPSDLFRGDSDSGDLGSGGPNLFGDCEDALAIAPGAVEMKRAETTKTAMATTAMERMMDELRQDFLVPSLPVRVEMITILIRSLFIGEGSYPDCFYDRYSR